ncbi:hypothetical protein [Cupriavidus pauculus]|uniref:Uncharacterized protein n=1 Tax=Cupriavidus pauculus TaxID=82633 RepID=A0A3G8H9P6_9BURK|nr:hypothetical protein [Cupriavidus pauculus]AZG17146.1 hypothetical protein EHF44_27120 [Cupriavidus pauculus]
MRRVILRDLIVVERFRKQLAAEVAGQKATIEALASAGADITEQTRILAAMENALRALEVRATQLQRIKNHGADLQRSQRRSG